MLRLTGDFLQNLKAAEIETSNFEKEWKDKFDSLQDSVFSSKEFVWLVWMLARVPCLILAIAIYFGFTSPYTAIAAAPCILYILLAKNSLDIKCEAQRQNFIGKIEGRLEEKKMNLRNTAQVGMGLAQNEARSN
jgi:hypothetical protein